MSKLKTSFELAKRSFSVLMENKRLLLFPFLTTVCTLGILLFVLMPVAFQPTGHSYNEMEHWEKVGSSIVSIEKTNSEKVDDKTGKTTTETKVDGSINQWVYIALVPLYFLSIFLAAFFNVAFYNEIIKALNGDSVSIMGGLKFAKSKLKMILKWTLFFGTIGCIIKFLETRLDIVGQYVLRMINFTFNVACLFVIPVMVRSKEDEKPWVHLKKSAQIIKDKWGETVVGFAGITGVGMIITFTLGFLWMLIFSISFLTEVPDNIIIIQLVAGFPLFIIFSACLSYVMGILNKIYLAALYVYATEGVIPNKFDEESMAGSWEVKE